MKDQDRQCAGRVRRGMVEAGGPDGTTRSTVRTRGVAGIRWVWLAVGTILVLGWSSGCDSTTSGRDRSVQTGKAASVSPLGSSSPLAPSHTAPHATTAKSAAQPDATRAPQGCSAAASSKLVMLAKVPGLPIGFALDGGSLFLATTTYHPGSRYGVYQSQSRIVRLGTSPGEPQELHKLEGKWPPLGLTVGSDGVYFTVQGGLHRVARDGSKHETVAGSFAQAIALHGQYVYGVGYDEENKLLQVVRVARTGGKVELLFSERPEKRFPDSPPLGQDIAVDATGIYVADEAQRRVMKLSHEDYKVTVLGAEEDYAGQILLDEDTVYWRNGEYLRMVPKKGGKARQAGEVRCWRMPLAMWGQTVYSLRPEVGGRYKCAAPFSLIALAPATGTAKLLNKLEWTSLAEVEVDEDCLYVAREGAANPVETWVQARGRRAPPE